MSAHLTIGEKTYEVEVSEIVFEQDNGYLEEITPYGKHVTYAKQTVSLSGVITAVRLDALSEIIRKEPAVSNYKDCETVCMDKDYEPLAKKVNDLDLDDDTRLLRKYRVVGQDGTLTGNGSEVLLNVLFKENKAAVVKALKALEAAEKK